MRMIVGGSERRTRKTVKIRRRGRHASPSQVERVAAQASKAAPAVVIAGALVTAPHLHHALAHSGKPAAPVARAASHTARLTAVGSPQLEGTAATLDSFSADTARDSARTYVVRSGDTLSGIAQRFYHKATDWQWLYRVNARVVANPNVIYVGQRLIVPASGSPSSYVLSEYLPRPVKPAGHALTASRAVTHVGLRVTSYRARIGLTDSESGYSRTHPVVPGRGTTDSSSSSSSAGWVPPSGTYSCSDLERLWDAAGGNPAEAFIAAEVAMAESGGNPNAISPTNDYGLWQINGSNGALATLNPYGNARAAVLLSSNGRNWGPWTTYTSGAYAGRC